MSPASEKSVAPSASLWIVAVVLTLAVLATWAVQVATAPINTDAGFYVPHARYVLDGEVPYRDFPSGYAPGIYYLLAPLGDAGLRSPSVLKLTSLAVQSANALLVFAVCARILGAPALALLFTAAFGGLTTAAWGIALQLEGFMNLFALLAFWLMLGEPKPWRGVLAGIALGCAVMVKQYGLFAAPPVLLACLAPLGRTDSKVRLSLGGGRGVQLACLLGAAPLPWVAFLLHSGLSPLDNLVHLATFGSGAAGYGAWGIGPMWELLVAGNVGRFLLPALALGVFVVAAERSWRGAALLVGMLLGMVPLYVRAFDYYVQSALPWSIFLMAEFCRVCGARFGAPVKTLAAALLVLPLISIAWPAGKVALSPGMSIDDQQQLVELLEAEVDGSEDVLVLNGSWLYVLTRFEPPLRDYTFNVDFEGDQERRSAARFAIILGGSGPVRQAIEWLSADGMSLRTRLRWEGRSVYVLDRESR